MTVGANPDSSNHSGAPSETAPSGNGHNRYGSFDYEGNRDDNDMSSHHNGSGIAPINDEELGDGGGERSERSARPGRAGTSRYTYRARQKTMRKTRFPLRPGLLRTENIRHIDSSETAYHVDWNEYKPEKGAGPVSWFRWIISGYSNRAVKSEEETLFLFEDLAHMISLLRLYKDRYGQLHEEDDGDGGPADRQLVLKELTQRLYSAGAPIWVLGEVMSKTAEGLTGRAAVELFLLPRTAFVHAPGRKGKAATTSMFKILRGYNFFRLDHIEKVTVRLASFASNTSSVTSVASKLPRPEEMRRLAHEQEHRIRLSGSEFIAMERQELAKEILDFASDGVGLFFFTNFAGDSEEGVDFLGAKSSDAFWVIDDSEKELFSRLACLEATDSIKKAEERSSKVLYPWWSNVIFRMGSSAGACAIWYSGSWIDMLVAACLGELVALVGNAKFSRQERFLSEVVASLLVGLITGLISLTWHEQTCFGAMSLGSVLNILQGFRAVYSIIEIMSRNTVSGGADFIEGIIFTALISYFLKFGYEIALAIMKIDRDDYDMKCAPGMAISKWWYFLWVPVASLSWSGLFSPYYDDLPIMAFHGCLGYTIYYFTAAYLNSESAGNFANFFSAMGVTVSAGIVSRFTGRQALGNTISGLYVLLPGAYLVREMFAGGSDEFIQGVILNAITIGLGAWTGNLVVSPTLLGTTRMLIAKQEKKQKHHTGGGAMLYF